MTNLFFGEKSKIVSGYAPLVLDDNEAYMVLYNTLKENAKDYDLNDENNIDKFVCNSVQKAVFKYFGNDSPNDIKRLMLYRNAYEKDEILSISKFKGTNLSMCSERSALAHNFFKLLGYNSSYLSGIIFLNGAKDLHSFNAVQLNSGYVIYDLICTPIKSLEENLPNPIMYKVNESVGKTIIENNGEINNLDLNQINFTTQTGKIFTISYGNLDKFNSFERE